MTLKVDIHELDEQIKFLGEQASRLRDLAARQPGSRWAESNARKMDKIAALLGELRRDQQMTGMNGKRIE